MAKARSLGLMAPFIMVCMSRGRNMVRDCLSGLMGLSTKESSGIIILRGQGFISGPMRGFTRANGRIIRCMAKGCLPGLMGGSMWGRILRIRSMGMESLRGLMEGCIKESGLMANNMDRALISRKLANLDKANGKTVKESLGLMSNENQSLDNPER